VRKPGLHKVISWSHIIYSYSPGGCWCTITRLFIACAGRRASDRASTWQGGRQTEVRTCRSEIVVIKHCKISDIIRGNEAQLEDDEPVLNSDITFFIFAPVTSCDAERSFSCYKMILSDNRRSFTFESLKMHVFIQCNPVNDGT
jgi:hypothetical protein